MQANSGRIAMSLSRCTSRAFRFSTVIAALALAVPLSLHAASVAPRAAKPLVAGGRDLSAGIVAVVNGDVISKADVDNRRRLFAISTGLPITQEVLDRLTPQVTQQLIDERLRLQEVKRRKVVISDKEIAAAIGEVEHQNNMPPGALRAKLAADGVELRTLIDEIRVQLGWGRVLHEQLGDN